jgi:signal transduction histidine kinase
VIEIADTGVGIPECDLPHIFERFYRADPVRSRETRGSGLGLSIAKWIAEIHGGSIAVKSQPLQGSLFTIRLPLAPYSADGAESTRIGFDTAEEPLRT